MTQTCIPFVHEPTLHQHVNLATSPTTTQLIVIQWSKCSLRDEPTLNVDIGYALTMELGLRHIMVRAVQRRELLGTWRPEPRMWEDDTYGSVDITRRLCELPDCSFATPCRDICSDAVTGEMYSLTPRALDVA